jgi:uncharacterized protein YkwD
VARNSEQDGTGAAATLTAARLARWAHRALLVAALLALAACGTMAAQHDAPPSDPNGESGADTIDGPDAAMLRELARLVNEARSEGRSCGRHGWFDAAPPVAVDATLMDVAQAHSADQAAMRTLSHVGSDGSRLDDRVERAGYAWSSLGENVAWNYRSAEAVMAGWLSSDGHCRNVMGASFEELGLGLEDWFWTQVFARPR